MRENRMALLNAVFFDIGGTLGTVDPASLKLELFDDTTAILSAMHALGLRLGVITNVAPSVDRDRVRTMLAEAQILDFFDEAGCITSTEAGSFKPSQDIFLFAADAIKLPIERCIYVGEDASQVVGAVVAGMQGILK